MRLPTAPPRRPIGGLDDTTTSSGRGTGEFTHQRGPVFANVVVDEINQATPKTQSAMLVWSSDS
jgi:MoxR-like ATPase